jgi:uncharacterized protein (TIGR00369 family)
MTKSIWKHRPSLDALQAMCRDSAIDRLGIEFTTVDDDGLGARMPVDRRTVQPMGVLHGGASVLLAETLASAAALHCVDQATSHVVGLEISANHVRAVRQGWVHGTARPIHLGRSTQLWDIRVTDDEGRLVSISRFTVAVVARDAG